MSWRLSITGEQNLASADTTMARRFFMMPNQSFMNPLWAHQEWRDRVRTHLRTLSNCSEFLCLAIKTTNSSDCDYLNAVTDTSWSSVHRVSLHLYSWLQSHPFVFMSWFGNSHPVTPAFTPNWRCWCISIPCNSHRLPSRLSLSPISTARSSEWSLHAIRIQLQQEIVQTENNT